MKKELKKYLAEIGSKGGKKSRRTITPAQQAAMQEARKAARLRKEQNTQVRRQEGGESAQSPD